MQTITAPRLSGTSERRLAPHLEFNGTTFEILDRNGRPWLPADPIAAALQLDHGEAALLDVHQRHWYEFTEAMFARWPIDTAEGPKAVPAFSPLGAYVAASLAQTPIAPRFRRWLLEHIDGFWAGLADTAQRLETEVQEQAAELARLRARLAGLEAERDRQAEELRRLGFQLERLNRAGHDPAQAGNDFAPDGLIPVCAGEIGGQPCQVVDLRDLHRFLGINLYVTSWVRSRIAEYGFVEDEDYAVSYRRGREHPQGGRTAADYQLSLEMAEALARFERSEKGREAQRWLAECREKLAERAIVARLGATPENTAPAPAPTPDSLGQALAFAFGNREVRGTWINGEPWWVAKDVLFALGYAESSLASITSKIAHVPEQWRGRHQMSTPGGCQEMLLISEQGLYFFLGRSDKPKALPFQMYYAGEVLPEIRKTGRYEEGARPEATPVSELSSDKGAAPVIATGLAPEMPGPGPEDRSLLFSFVGHPVRVEIRRGAVLFIAKDVAEALGYRWDGFSGVFARIPFAERKYCRMATDTATGMREIAAITEAGLRILFRNSGQPKALREGFLAWLEATVLPGLTSQTTVDLSGEAHIPQPMAVAILQSDATPTREVLIYQGASIRVEIHDGQPWFAIRDVLAALEIPGGWVGPLWKGVPVRIIPATGDGPESKAYTAEGLRKLSSSHLAKRPAFGRNIAAFQDWLARLEAPEQGEPSAVKISHTPLPPPARIVSDPGLPDTGWVFQFDGHTVRVERREGITWFIARDVAAAVGCEWHGFSGAFADIPGYERGYLKFERPGRTVCALTENGMRKFLDLANRAKTVRFGLWLEESVLPALRGDGTAPPITPTDGLDQLTHKESLNQSPEARP